MVSLACNLLVAKWKAGFVVVVFRWHRSFVLLDTHQLIPIRCESSSALMTIRMPYSGYGFEAVSVKRPYYTFTLVYRLVLTGERITASSPFSSYKLSFQEGHV
tara:strand:+ start:135 stop:443 length:309 start_codon:yes stop_codon:yes gene_type:complete